MAKGALVVVIAGLALMLLALSNADSEVSTYVGSKVCGECHDYEFSNFREFSKKSKSDHSVKIMSAKLTKEELNSCFSCHTTGFGQPGGFKSFTETPDLAHAGCEVCHGPGSLHVEFGGDPSYIKRKLSLQDCESCHNQERVNSFNFKPLLYGGAH
jgi:hypothetical protein